MNITDDNLQNPGNESAPPLAGVRVFVAEDEPLLLMLLTDMLGDLGCRVTGSAAQVGQAMRLASAEATDVAILDVNLREADIAPLVAIFDDCAVPVVLATGYDPSEITKRFPQAIVLSKPYSNSTLRQALEWALHRVPNSGF